MKTSILRDRGRTVLQTQRGKGQVHMRMMSLTRNGQSQHGVGHNEWGNLVSRRPGKSYTWYSRLKTPRTAPCSSNWSCIYAVNSAIKIDSGSASYEEISSLARRWQVRVGLPLPLSDPPPCSTSLLRLGPCANPPVFFQASRRRLSVAKKKK